MPDRHGPRDGARRTRVLAAACAVAALGVPAAACATSSTDRSRAGGKVGNTLTIITSASPQTLDPAKTVQQNAIFEAAAYEPLIVRRSDGTLQPGLATSWRYAGKDNRTLDLELRSGVTFADGSPLTARAVVDHFKYVVRSGGQYAPFFAGDTFTATGALTVRIKTAKPNPDLPGLLTQDNLVGGVISPAGLKNPAGLGTHTYGAGRYVLDPARTVAGDHYTYVANPRYHDTKAVHWKRLVIRVMASPQATLNAVRTGQAQFAVGDLTTVTAARRAGLTVTSTPFLWTGVTLADRDGRLAAPLADVRVRQALNHATDRASIARALFPGTGEPAVQLTAPGGYGYDAALNGAYPYDVAKARRLLAQAGHPGGFTLKIVTADFNSMNLVAQALAQQWKKIGVTLEITDHANANQYLSATFGAKFPAFMTNFGQQPVWTEGPALFLPGALFNPFRTSDGRLRDLYDRAAKASGDAKLGLDQQVKGYLVRQAWFVPVVTTGLPFYASGKVTGTGVSTRAPLASLYEVRPGG